MPLSNPLQAPVPVTPRQPPAPLRKLSSWPFPAARSPADIRDHARRIIATTARHFAAGAPDA